MEACGMLVNTSFCEEDQSDIDIEIHSQTSIASKIKYLKQDFHIVWKLTSKNICD